MIVTSSILKSTVIIIFILYFSDFLNTNIYTRHKHKNHKHLEKLVWKIALFFFLL